MVAAGDSDAVTGHIGDLMDQAGLSAHAGRTPAEIAARLIEKSALERVRLSSGQWSALRTFLSIHQPLESATETLLAFASENGIALDGAVERFQARADAIAANGLGLTEINYDAAFGRPLDYYTGLVFGIVSASSGKALAGGGRYDRLLTMLGAQSPIPGVGFSVWLDRIAAERGGSA